MRLPHRRGLQQLARRQVADQPVVGGQELIIGKVFEADPAHLLIDAGLDLAGELMHGKELQIDGAAMAVVVADVRDARANGGADAEFLVQFADECLLGAFAGLDLAAGKLPLQRHRLIRTALTDQDFAAAHDECGRHKAKGGSGGPGIGNWLGLFHTSSVNAPKGMQNLRDVV